MTVTRSNVPSWLLLAIAFPTLVIAAQIDTVAGPTDGAEYVGIQACAACHGHIAASFAEHGMARTFRRMTPEWAEADWSGSHVVVDSIGGYHYQPIAEDGRFYIREYLLGDDGAVTHDQRREVHYSMGSGINDRAYIHERQGYLYMMPLEWYVSVGWAFAPAYEHTNQRLDRGINTRCMTCHNAMPSVVSEASHRFELPLPEGVDCERCHGPGSIHVERQQRGAFDDREPAIVNPARLTFERQIDVCAQCHLQGDADVLRPGKGEREFRPGDALRDHRDAFVPDAAPVDAFGFVRHVERMQLSRCFTESAGGDAPMTCTTCHDPHKTSKGRPAAYWSERCLSCHELADCDLEHMESQLGSPGAEGCVTCHMRRSQPNDVLHVAIHDHWIRSRVAPPSETPVSRYRADPAAPLVHYEWLDGALDDPGALALAYDGIGFESAVTEVLTERFGSVAASIPALADPRALLLASSTLLAAGDSAAARSAIERALELDPERPSLYAARARLELARGAVTRGLEDARRAVEGDPSDVEARAALASAEALHGSVEAAARAYRELLLLRPYDVEAWLGLGELELRAQEFEAARDTYAGAVALAPRAAAAFFGLGVAEFRLGNSPAALLAYRRAVDIDASHADAHYNMGNLLVMSDPAAAEAAYRSALAARPDHPAAIGNLGFTLMDLGRDREALAAFERLLELRPDDATARRAVEILRAKM